MKLLKEHANSALLFVMVVLFVAVPMAENRPAMRFALDALVTLVLLAAVFAEAGRISYKRPIFWCVLATYPLRALATSFPGDAGSESYRALLIGVEIYYASLLFYICYSLLRRVTRAGAVGWETIAGVAAIYVLLTVAFASLHMAVYIYEPASTAYNNTGLVWPTGKHEGSPFADWMPTFMYYSVVTQTTLGYGDITPNSALSRGLTMSQTIFGQLYLAIILARIVAMELASRQLDDPE